MSEYSEAALNEAIQLAKDKYLSKSKMDLSKCQLVIDRKRVYLSQIGWIVFFYWKFNPGEPIAAPNGGAIIVDYHKNVQPYYCGGVDEMVLHLTNKGKSYTVTHNSEVKKVASMIFRLERISARDALRYARERKCFTGNWDDCDFIRCLLEHFGIASEISEVNPQRRKSGVFNAVFDSLKFYYEPPKMIIKNQIVETFDPLRSRGTVQCLEYRIKNVL